MRFKYRAFARLQGFVEAVCAVLEDFMADADENLQVVTFFLGNELYGVSIMDVKELVKTQPVREIPGLPYFVEGIFNLRDEIIPVINLHKRFKLEKLDDGEIDEFSGGIVILSINDMKLGVVIDKISRVVSVSSADLKQIPHLLTGIGREYIYGIAKEDEQFLIILDTAKLFSEQELRQIYEVAE